MLKIRRSDDRGLAVHGWLHSRHTFSFANYFDAAHRNFGPLRVINEDRIKGGTGFGAHPHRDMEIITYVLSGALEHSDSMGTKKIIRPGEVQHMSAGSGVVHSEYNPLPEEETHLLQIWILPAQKGIAPHYGQKSFATALAKHLLVLAASQDGRDGSLAINQDADVFLGKLKVYSSLHFGIRPGRGIWVQVLKGQLLLQDEELREGDGAAITDDGVLELLSQKEAEFMVFDLPLTGFD